MGKCLFNFIVLTSAFAAVFAAYDSDFCARHMGAPVAPSSSDPQRPVFFDNFYVLLETKTLASKLVETTDQYFSQQAEMAYARILNPTTPVQIWVNAMTDEVTLVPDTAQGEVCIDTVLANSIFFSMYRVTPDPNVEHFDLSRPAAIFGWDSNTLKQIAYKGSDKSRGIATNKWWACDYVPFNDTTLFTEWQIVDPSNLVLPVISKDNSQSPSFVLPISSKVITLDKSDPRNLTETVTMVDFTHFAQIQHDDRHFRVPPNMICANSPSSQIPLPKMPTYFRFRGEQVMIENPDPPALTYTIEEYNHDFGVFVQDFIDIPDPNSLNDKSYSRNVADFNTGVTYAVNLNTGSCVVNPIDGSNVGAFSMAGGFVQMRDANQFFDLDSDNYTYMGLNYVEGRGIECDVWSAYFTNYSPDKAMNTLYTWYFASAGWMKAQGYRQVYPMPVMLELTSPNRLVQFHFFEYSTQPSTPPPDLSPCFSPDSTMNIQLFVFKARYDQVYKSNPIGFRMAFIKAMMTYTSLKSGLRIADLDFQPSANNEIQVQFKLLDKPNMSGDVQNPVTQAPNSQVFNELSDKINSGTFSFDVTNPPSQSPGKQTVYVRPNSITVLTSADVMTYTISFDPRTGTAHSQLSSPSSSGYSAGSMAGIGMGMLIAGLLVGVLVVFLVKKFRGGGAASGITMKRMESES
ncbi:hypothetical protein Btru_070292 [Bulinus truncatus]|nr:hypothetical protein Btru_070292 [Bulinus truncatus]